MGEIKQIQGNVGIGTTDPTLGAGVNSIPSKVLVVMGDSTGSGAVGASRDIADGDGVSYGDFDVFHGSTTATEKRLTIMRGGTDGSTANNRGGRFDFYVKNDGSTDFNQAMVIRSSGRVGIGTATPGQTLHVAGSANISTTVNTPPITTSQ